MVCATSKASDQPAHTRSLIRDFASRYTIMNVKLLTEHHFEIPSLKGGCTGSSESTLVKFHIVGNHVSRLIFFLLSYHSNDGTWVDPGGGGGGQGSGFSAKSLVALIGFLRNRGTDPLQKQFDQSARTSANSMIRFSNCGGHSRMAIGPVQLLLEGGP